MKRTLATAALAALASVFAPCARGDAVAKIGDAEYATLAEAVAAANALGGEVTVEVYGKGEYTASTANLGRALTKISFVGKTDDAEICITRNGSGGYIFGDTYTSPAVEFTDLTLSKSSGFYANDAGYMNTAFTVYRVASVTYTGCTFPNGACGAGCTTTFTRCSFGPSYGKYSLWAYGNALVTVESCDFLANDRAIKLWAEGNGKTTDLVVRNSDFSKIASNKPAIVLTSGRSVTLEGNIYSAKGVFELDADGVPDGTAVAADIADIACKNDNYSDCGVLVDGKMYTTLTSAVAAGAVAEGSEVTLFYSPESEAAVTLPEGVTLKTNGYAASNVTVPVTEDVNAVQSANLLGAVKVVSAAENVFVAAPFEAFGADGGAVKAVEAVPAAGRADGEKLYAWDGEKYNVWTASGGSWTPARKVTVAQGADGETEVSEGVDADAAVAAGGGLILSRAASDGTAATVYIHGQVPAEGEAVVSVPASAAGSLRTLVSPVGADAAAALDLNALDWTGVAASAGRGRALTAPGDYVYFRGADGKVVQYFYLNGRWGALKGGLFDAAGGAEVPAGTAFWYANDKGLSGAVKAVRK